MPDYRIPLQPDGIYHILNHANGFENVFANEGNYSYFLERFIFYIHPLVKTYAYCLMPNHFHMLIRVRSEAELLSHWRYCMKHDPMVSLLNVASYKGIPLRKVEADNSPPAVRHLRDVGQPKTISELEVEIDFPQFISSQFKRFFASYAKGFNVQQKRKGSLFIPKFKRSPVTTEDYFFTCLRYIHQNPVRHGFTKELMEWKHSSIHSFMGDRKSRVEREEVLKWFGEKHQANQKEFWLFHNRDWDIDDLDLEI